MPRRDPRPLLVFLLALAPAASAGGAPAGEQAPASLDLGRMPDDRTLAQLLWARSPDLVTARSKLASARSEVVRADVLPNPSLDASWNTIPVGRTNPPDLSDPLEQVPNYAVSLSMLVEIAKRGPRQRAARSGFEAAALDTYELLRQRYYDTLERIAEVAAAQVRVAALGDLVGDAHRLTELQQERTRRGDAPGVDADRAALEEDKYAGTLRDERQKLAEGLVACGHTAGVPCRPFADAKDASAYLSRGIRAAPGDLDTRPDIRSLAAQQASATASLELAHNKRIPDPTFRIGYVYDQFVVAGNQRNSLMAGVSVPLPVFDRGQADALAAAASADAAGRAQALLVTQAERDAAALATQAEDVAARRRALTETSLPLARRLVDTLERAVRQGGTSLSELLLARRSLGELVLDDADVELLAFRVDAALARNGAAGPPAPPDLAPVP